MQTAKPSGYIRAQSKLLLNEEAESRLLDQVRKLDFFSITID
jgi:hypothetical protein